VPRKPKRGVPNPNRPPGNWSMIQEENEQLRLEVEILKETVKVLKKEPGVGSEELSNREKAVIVDALRKKTHRSLPMLLKILNLPHSSYYYAKTAADRPDRHVERRGRIRDIFASNYSCYGSRRIHAELKRQGDVVSEKIVRQLMREEGLVVRIRRYHPYTSYLGEISPAVPDHLERDFRAERPNEKWVTDITEFSIPAGKFYLSPILDCCGGNVVSWNGGPKPDAQLANAALRNALGTLSDTRPILHSDRGSHYRWPEWIRLVEENGLTRSMSRKGCSPDNSACEGFFGRLKNECFYGLTFMGMSLDEFKNYIGAYIVWYNERRIKLSLGGRSPAEYRAFEFGL